MNRNAWISAVVIAIVFAGGGFYVGMKYEAGQSPAARFAAAGAYAGRTGAAGAGAARFGGGAAGGFTAGTVISNSGGSITIQLAASTSTASGTGTKIVLVDDNTQIQKTTTGAMSDLTAGQSVTVSGTANSDGSITATSIQLRPAGMRTPNAQQ